MNDFELWHNKWAANKIGFHLEDVNPLLIEHWPVLEPTREQSVFVPLCGKSEDLVWLAQRHDNVQGVELSQIAVRSFFAEHFYTPLVTTLNHQFELYQFDELNIYVGDFFTAPIESVDLIYDRAALIAMPADMRLLYIDKLKQVLKPGGRILLVTLDYIQDEMAGPPYSVPQLEVENYFDNGFRVTRLARDEADSEHRRIKQGLSHFCEDVWLIESLK
ncbi:thiopurine S-methyltransferase [Vibrio sp. 10N.286.49.C2]|uniref:thiopurine S-methyltransferase n=1 Tax=unclassified Vibrio TaxID=2614977 RepID=UPI000C84A0AF|nr:MULTISPECIES: thiopurine S-methyltransferase [unclassified Vibrio]PMH37204.1 thiopurine S-methyltransferase [Vibrio sp. 10N.286.49.C2]PMH57349.1 thiopurine S-methyltransferase [Vibrio sp. 10N.286.49.B1]PMH83952.1 thiopurine S-methyltransferase [Vibrio sp. 10N.286.48.B7]